MPGLPSLQEVLTQQQFQKIYVLSMPGRSDKRDMMALTAHLSGIQFEFVDGVNGANVPVVARPDVR